MLVAGMRAGERRAQYAQEQQVQQQQVQQQAYQQGMQAQQATQQTPQAPAAAPPTKNITAELQKLADLHNSGVLTDAEFATAKNKLLSS